MNTRREALMQMIAEAQKAAAKAHQRGQVKAEMRHLQKASRLLEDLDAA